MLTVKIKALKLKVGKCCACKGKLVLKGTTIYGWHDCCPSVGAFDKWMFPVIRNMPNYSLTEAFIAVNPWR